MRGGTDGEGWERIPREGIVDTAAARTSLGFRPIFPTVYTAKAAGAF